MGIVGSILTEDALSPPPLFLSRYVCYLSMAEHDKLTSCVTRRKLKCFRYYCITVHRAI